MEMFSLGKSEKIFQIKKFLQYNCLFFRIICSELLRTFTKETFLFEIFFHFSPIKTFPFGLILMGHISVFQVNGPKSMNFFYNFNIFRISCDKSKSAHISYTCYLCYLQVESNLCILDSILDICESRCLVMCNNLYTKFHLIYPWHQRRHYELCEMGILFCSRQSQYCVCIFLSDNRLVDNFLKPSVVCSTITARA